MPKYILYALYVLVLIVGTFIYSHFNAYNELQTKVDKIETKAIVVVDKVNSANTKLEEVAKKFYRGGNNVRQEEINTSIGSHSIRFY